MGSDSNPEIAEFVIVHNPKPSKASLTANDKNPTNVPVMPPKKYDVRNTNDNGMLIN